MDNGLIFDNFLSAVEWAEDNIREDFMILKQPDGRYLVRENESLDFSPHLCYNILIN